MKGNGTVYNDIANSDTREKYMSFVEMPSSRTYVDSYFFNREERSCRNYGHKS